MNGSCAGGTGAFIDQMATLLDVTPAELDALSQRHGTHLHHRLPLRRVRQDATFSRCSTRARARRTLPRQHLPGGRQPDHRRPGAGTQDRGQGAVSRRAAVSSVRGCGSAFVETLKLDDGARRVPGATAVCSWRMGAAHVRGGTHGDLHAMTSCCERIEKAARAPIRCQRLPPLFEDEAGVRRIYRTATPRTPCRTRNVRRIYAATPIWASTAARTTTKLALIGRGRRACCTPTTQSNNGNPVRTWCREQLREDLRAVRRPRASSAAAAVTGYGEDLIQNAFQRGHRSGRDDGALHARRATSARMSTSSSTSAGRTSSASKSATAPSTTSCSTRPAPPAAARLSRRLPSSMGYDIAGFCQAGPVRQAPRRPRLAAARCS